MKQLPVQFQNDEFRFLIIPARQKKPIGTWKKEDKHLRYDNPKLIKHLEKSGNVGVIGGYGGLIAIDCDRQELLNHITTSLPQTLMEKTGKGIHVFYVVDNIDTYLSIDLKDTEGKEVHYGEVRGDKKHQTVIAPSIHENGTEYHIVADVPIAHITQEDLDRFLATYQNRTAIEWKKYEGENNNIGFPITAVVDLSKFKSLSNGEYQGSHPVHDSTTGMNFCINTTKNIWHCFRHNCGGSTLQLIGMKENMIECGQRLSTSDYLKCMTIAKEKYGINAFVIKEAERKTTQTKELISVDLPPLEYHIEPFIPKGSLVLFGGKPSSFKSMLILNMAMFMSSGNKYLNLFKTDHNQKILLYDLENGERILARRMKYMINGNPLIADQNFTVCYDFDKINIGMEREFASKYDIIILDSYRRFLKGEENSSEITDEFYKEFLKPLRDSGKTIIILHHFRKSKPEDLNDEDLQDMFRGSSDIPAQFDLIYGVMKTQEFHDTNKISFNVSCIPSKNRLGIDVSAFIMKVEKNDLDMRTGIDFVKFGYVSSEDETQEILINELKGKTLKRGAMIAILKDKTRLSIRTIVRRIKDMEDAGLIFKTSYGTYSDKPEEEGQEGQKEGQEGQKEGQEGQKDHKDSTLDSYSY
jgi:archaellum biogenesis ATPase FlaH